MQWFLQFITSLRLTVICLAMAIVLVFAGTLAQVEVGLWDAQKSYFQSFLVFWRPEGWSMRIPVWPGGYLLGWVLVLNLIAAHFKRFKFSRKKTGILLTHAGVLVLLLGQFLTEIFQVESFMRLEEGETKSYSESHRKTELAIVEMTGDNSRVTVIADTVLQKRGEIHFPELPFTLRVKEWSANSQPQFNRRDGLTFKRSATSAKLDEMNFPVIAIEIHANGTSLFETTVSSYLCDQRAAGSIEKWLRNEFGIDPTPIMVQPQFTHDGKTYQFSLRPARYYKFNGGSMPHTLTLLDFRHDLYPGTTTAKNFSSLVRVTNPQTGEEREALIQMNSPLRHGGEAYYQGSFDPENDRVTILQVVRNPVWLAPYISCLLIAAGLLVHFFMGLVSFARHAQSYSDKPKPVPFTPEKDILLARLLPACALIWICAGLPPRKDASGMARIEFGKLPVMLSGRIQPIDSMARNALLAMSGKSVVRIDEGKDTLPAIDWFLEVIFKPTIADTRKVFRLENMELRARFGAMEGRFGFISFNEVTPQLQKIAKEANQIAIHKKEAQLRNGYERDIVHLYDSIILYQRLKNTFQPENTEDFEKELEAYKRSLPAAKTLIEDRQSQSPAESEELTRLGASFRRYEAISRVAYGLVVPLEGPRSWESMGTACLEAMRTGAVPEVVRFYGAISSAYNRSDAVRFNSTLSEYRQWLTRNGFQFEANKASQEAYFNQVEFFFRSMILYVAASLLGCISWIGFSDTFRRAAVRILALTFLMHTAGLIFRMVLDGRPPVTNLYSSAVFVGWGSVLLGLIIERFYRGGTGTVVAGLIGFVTLIIAHHLSLSGDTMPVLQAVLDTNLWLSTHVVVVVSGYAAMFLAGVIGGVYIVRCLIRGGADNAALAALPRMVFGIVCFAMLFSFTGTVLGGIWADQSWGRFWGWDPKENGALMIVLWCAVILHARLGGLVRDLGMMVLAVFGNIITAFSWFGVNLLGVGLHNYGFMEGAFRWLFIFIASQLALIVLAVLFQRKTARTHRRVAQLSR